MPRPECRPERTRDMADFVGADRPGHHQHPVHDLRPRRRRGRPPPARARADPAAGRAGWSTTRSRSGSAPRRSSQSALNTTEPAAADLAALGITNQRETTVVWNRQHRPARTTTRSSGRTPAPTASPSALDRDGRGDVIRRKAGLPPATYFSGGKVQWILENVDGVREAAETRRRDLRHHRHLGAVEPHRRRRTAACTSPTSPTPAAPC